MSEIRHRALSVPCPVCRAPRRADCVAPRKPGSWHVQRARRGIRGALRDDLDTHYRAVAAMERVRAGSRRGAPVDGYDVAIALSCGGACGECGGVENMLRIGDELRRYGAL